jgi:hypothetical protein
MQFLPIFKDRAFLVSPLDVTLYLLEIRALKDEQIAGEIRNRLKTLYPGCPEDTVFDYRVYDGPDGDAHSGFLKKREPVLTAAVFVGSKTVCESYKNLGRPLVPGISLMALGLRTAKETLKETTRIVVLNTPQWTEIALFEGERILQYASCPLGQDGLPVPLITPFLNGPESKGIPVLLISMDSQLEENEKTEKVLSQLFGRIISLAITDISVKGNITKWGIFNESKYLKQVYRRNIVSALAAMSALSLLASLQGVSAKTAGNLSLIREYCREQDTRRSEAERLEGEIAKIKSRQITGKEDQAPGIYEIISQLGPCLSGAWIKSLVIQDEHISLEAEGADSIGVLQAMQKSGYFSGLVLHQASPSKISGELFTISGKAAYEKK